MYQAWACLWLSRAQKRRRKVNKSLNNEKLNIKYLTQHLRVRYNMIFCWLCDVCKSHLMCRRRRDVHCGRVN